MDVSMDPMKKSITVFARWCVASILIASPVVWASEPTLSASGVVVSAIDEATPVLAKNATMPFPIASITKLMTAMILIDADLPPNEKIEITEADVDVVKHSRSRIPVGTVLTRSELLELALMSSENRAAHALARTYPSGVRAFVFAMNDKARTLNMISAKFTDPTGLQSTNIASPLDVAKMATAAHKYEQIRRFTTTQEDEMVLHGRAQTFRNTNSLVRGGKWPIELSKTGFIEEAGRCLVMLTTVVKKSYVMVFLSANSTFAREQDARKVRAWIDGETYSAPRAAVRVLAHKKVKASLAKPKRRKHRS
jgi:D-alanyl-D-alanine endopeptidase (penicillin-binding protein 7)